LIFFFILSGFSLFQSRSSRVMMSEKEQLYYTVVRLTD
jgi:hypothetical protein